MSDAELTTLFRAAVVALEAGVDPDESYVARTRLQHALGLLSRQERPVHLDDLIRYAQRVAETPPPRRPR